MEIDGIEPRTTSPALLAVVGHNFAATKWTNQVQRTSGGHTDWGAAVVTPVGDENTLSVIIYVSTDHGAWKYALVGAPNALAHRLIRALPSRGRQGRLHDFRHFHATKLRTGGVPVRVVVERPGHPIRRSPPGLRPRDSTTGSRCCRHVGGCSDGVAARSASLRAVPRQRSSHTRGQRHVSVLGQIRSSGDGASAASLSLALALRGGGG